VLVASVILATWEAEIRRFEASLGKQFERPTPTISKKTTAKWARGVAQVLELLLCKHEALNSSKTKQQWQQNDATNMMSVHTYQG
jgi:hypothetical protein